MRFFYAYISRSNRKDISISYYDYADRREAFLTTLKHWNEADDGCSYQEVPPSCVKKLFPNWNWEYSPIAQIRYPI